MSHRGPSGRGVVAFAAVVLTAGAWPAAAAERQRKRPGRFRVGPVYLTPKLVEFQREVVPRATTIAALFNPANPTNTAAVANLRGVAGAVGMTVLPVRAFCRPEITVITLT